MTSIDQRLFATDLTDGPLRSFGMIRVLYLAIATAVLTCALFFNVSHVQSTNPVTTAEPPVVTLATAQMSEVLAGISISGTLLPAEEALVNTLGDKQPKTVPD